MVTYGVLTVRDRSVDILLTYLMVSLFVIYVIHIHVNLYCVHTYIIKTSWRYSDLISRSFYNHLIFHIIYADIFILIKLCCSAGATTCHQTRYIYVPEASAYYHIKPFKMNILVRTCSY